LLGASLISETKGRFGSSCASLPELLPYAVKLDLEWIGNSDALYHNVEHTMLVTLVGRDILIGRALLRPTTASDYAHFMFACLIHDIGYVRGIIHGDQDRVYVVDGTGRTVELPGGSSTPRLRPTTSTGPNHSLWTVWTLSTKLTRLGLPAGQVVRSTDVDARVTESDAAFRQLLHYQCVRHVP
jgi:hypothetical protein